jgi:hypothetical protein
MISFILRRICLSEVLSYVVDFISGHKKSYKANPVAFLLVIFRTLIFLFVCAPQEVHLLPFRQ